jgi:hypothetical protein
VAGFAHRRSHALELVRGRHPTRGVKPPNRRKRYARKSSSLSKGARGALSIIPWFCVLSSWPEVFRGNINVDYSLGRQRALGSARTLELERRLAP